MRLGYFIVFIIGIVVGWITVPLVGADSSNEVRTYMSALKRLVVAVEKIQVSSQENADNTKAIREKMGAK